MQAHIEAVDGKIKITAPYSELNNESWRTLGGKLSSGSWLIPDNDTSRKVIAELFGTKSNDVEVFIPYDMIKIDGSIIQFKGYVLAQRRFRDSKVRMPDGVSLAQGKFTSSGGSVKNPRVNINSEMIFRVSVRESFAKLYNLLITDTTPTKIEI